jgi:multiple sugar transport system permease protein
MDKAIRPAMTRRGKGTGIHRAERRFVAISLVPAVLFYLIFRFYPLGYAFFMSLHNWQLLSLQQPFVGLQNYGAILSDPLFMQVLANTFYFAFASSIALTVLSFILALVLNPIGRGNRLFQLLYFLPVVTSTIAISTIWLWLLQPRFGAINEILGALNLPQSPWLTAPDSAMPGIIIMSIWAGVGFDLIIFLAGLRGIPSMYYEAAAIDGASPLRQIWHITVPLLSPVTTFVFVTSLIEGFNVFQQVYLMTQGGPLNATRVLALHIYETAFQDFSMGQAASMAFVLFGIVLVLTLLQLRLRRIDWEY